MECTFQRYGRDEELPITQILHSGQLVIIPSQKSPPALHFLFLALKFLYTPFLTMCLEQSARGFTSMEAVCLEAIWRHWSQIPQQQHKDIQEKTQIKSVIPQIINNYFHQEPLI